MELSGKKMAILATNGFEQSELEVPQSTLKQAGATVEVISLKAGEIKELGQERFEGGRVRSDKPLESGIRYGYERDRTAGQRDPIRTSLRVEPKALAFIKEMFDAKKVVAAVCHAPWLLIETGIASGRKMTSYKSLKTDVSNTRRHMRGRDARESSSDQGRHYVAQSQRFESDSCTKIIEEVKEGRHTQRSAA